MSEYDFRDNLITLAVFQSATEAMLLKARLEAEGIAAEVDGDVASTMLSHLGAGLVNTRVVIRQTPTITTQTKTTTPTIGRAKSGPTTRTTGRRRTNPTAKSPA